MPPHRSGTVVIGLDGAHFEILEPWIDQGHLPNIRKLIDTGVSGDLESVIPPVTSPNWKAYATGKNPGKLGLFWWENIDVENRSIYYPEERKHIHTEYWDILAENESVGVLGVPTTHPPKSIGEFFISGAPDGSNSGFVYPDHLESELRERYDYQVVAEHKVTEHRTKAAEELLDLIDLRFHVAIDLFNEYDLTFLQMTTFYINTLQHYFWDGDYTREAWERIDERLGEFLDRDLNVVLMSDHGSTKIDHSFHINQWLEQEGYLVTDLGVSHSLHRFGVTSERLGRVASRFGLRSLLTQILPDSVLRRIPNQSGEVSKSGKATVVDWESSKALASGQGPVYVLEDKSGMEYESLRTELIERLEEIRTPNGEPIADSVHRTEEIYQGPYLDEAPALLIDQCDGIHIPGDVGRGDIFTRPSDESWLGENKSDGLFIATGPDFTTGRVHGLSILDLAPTLLHLHASAVPNDMDGRVRTDIFAETSPARDRPISYSEGDDVGEVSESTRPDKAVADRLEDLGYL